MSFAINDSFVPRRQRLARFGAGGPVVPAALGPELALPVRAMLPTLAAPDAAAGKPLTEAKAADVEERASSFAGLAALPVLSAYLVSLYVRPQDWVPALQNAPIDWVIFAALLLLVPFRLRRLTSHVGRSPVFWLLMAWLVVIGASNLVHGDLWQTKTALNVYGRRAIVFLDILLFVENDRALRFLMWVMVALTALLAWQAIDMIRVGVGWAGQPLGWNDGFGGRAQWVGLWDGPDVFCLLFVVATPFLLEFVVKPWSWTTRLLAAPLIPLMVYAIYLTQSRGGFMALALGTGIWAFGRFGLRKGVAMAAIAGAVLVAVAPGRMGHLDDRDTNRSAYNRVEMWQASVTMLRTNPVLGVGKMRFSDYGKEETGRSMLAHNTFVENMGETGLAGLFVFIALYYATAKGLRQNWRTQADARVRSTANALLVSLAAFVAASMFVTTEFDLLYVQLALAAAFLTGSGRTPKLSWKDVPIVAAVELGFVIFIYAFVRVYL